MIFKYNKTMEKEAKDIIKYFRSLGLEVHTSTKARGHQGFYLRKRIDISKNISEKRLIPTLLHEFAHYIHSKIEPFMEKYGGTLEIIFDDNNTQTYKKELIKVTHYVDSQSKCEKLNLHKQALKSKILEYERIIKNKYPKFLRSKSFKEFDKYIKKSNARFLLKYDRVKLISGIIFKKEELYTIDNIEKDFKDMPKEFAAYIRLHSCQKKQKKISARINKMNKYYQKPTELFARLIEGLYLNPEKIYELAPHTYQRFYELLNSGYYKELSEVFENYYKPVNL